MGTGRSTGEGNDKDCASGAEDVPSNGPVVSGAARLTCAGEVEDAGLGRGVTFSTCKFLKILARELGFAWRVQGYPTR